MADTAVGEVETPLGTLKCSLAAAKQVSSLASGYQGVLSRLAMMDFDTYAAVVAAGLGKRQVDVEEKVYLAGLVNLTAPLVTFVTNLGNGGKPFKAAEGGGETGEA